MQCPHCKKSIDDHANFCEHCGKEVNENKENNDKQEEDNTIPPKKNRMVTWMIALALAIIILLIIREFRKEPPITPPPAAMNVNLKADFFNTLSKGISELNQGRYYFRAAGMLRLANEATPSPESNRYQPVAENYAKAWEHFSHAKKAIDEAPRIDNPKAELCRKNFVEIADKYATASGIFNEYAKDLSKNEAARAERAPLTDAQAKYEIADQLMSAFLMEGCKGEYFSFVKTRNQNEKKSILEAYQNFYGDRFPAIQSNVQEFFSYQAITESGPAPR